jgi:hypothetical protein
MANSDHSKFAPTVAGRFYKEIPMWYALAVDGRIRDLVPISGLSTNKLKDIVRTTDEKLRRNEYKKYGAIMAQKRNHALEELKKRGHSIGEISQ